MDKTDQLYEVISVSDNDIDLNALYDELNKQLFDGRLPKIPVVAMSSTRAGGCTHSTFNRLTQKFVPVKIEMNKRMRYGSLDELKGILAHEMAHVAVEVDNNWFSAKLENDIEGGHGPLFKRAVSAAQAKASFQIPGDRTFKEDDKIYMEGRKNTADVYLMQNREGRYFVIMVKAGAKDRCVFIDPKTHEKYHSPLEFGAHTVALQYPPNFSWADKVAVPEKVLINAQHYGSMMNKYENIALPRALSLRSVAKTVVTVKKLYAVPIEEAKEIMANKPTLALSADEVKKIDDAPFANYPAKEDRSAVRNESINEARFGSINKKQDDITDLYPTFYDRVQAVYNKGGVRFVNETPGKWFFKVHSGTKKSTDYDVVVEWNDLPDHLPELAKDKKLWKTDHTGLNITKLGVEIIDRANIKFSCSCPNFLYGGFKYIATNFTDPDKKLSSKTNTVSGPGEGRPPVKRNPGQHGIGCKHVQAVLDRLPYFSVTLGKHVLEFYRKELIAAEKVGAKALGFVSKRTVAVSKGLGKGKPRQAAQKPVAPSKMPFKDTKTGVAPKSQPPKTVGQQKAQRQPVTQGRPGASKPSTVVNKPKTVSSQIKKPEAR